MAKPFQGVVNLDVRDSTPDWGPYRAEEAPEGAPNVLIVLYDDTGLARGRRLEGGSRCRPRSASPITACCIRSGTPPRCAHRPARAS